MLNQSNIGSKLMTNVQTVPDLRLVLLSKNEKFAKLTGG